MKKIQLLAIMCLLSITAHAQLSVDSIGNVNICDLSSIPSINPEKYGLRVRHDKPEGISVYSYGIPWIGDDTNIQYGINSFNYGGFPEVTAINGLAAKTTFRLPSGNVFGVKGIALGGGSNNLGVYGYATIDDGNFAAAIYGTTGAQSVTGTGTYAGYFNGDVKVTGTIIGTVLSRLPILEPIEGVLHASGDDAEGNAATVTSSVTDQLQQVELMRFKRSAEDADTATYTLQTDDLAARMEEVNGTTSTLRSTNEKPIQTEPATVGYALHPEQLQKVFPELVYEDKEGNYSINYIEMVPLLVQSIRELSAEVSELRQQLGLEKPVKKAPQQTTNIEEAETEFDMVKMDQNKPNPFSGSTVIGLNIPKGTLNASIYVYDLSGKQVQNIPVNERGSTNITFYARTLTAGMYIYTLVVDGKSTVTRRMIVSKS